MTLNKTELELIFLAIKTVQTNYGDAKYGEFAKLADRVWAELMAEVPKTHPTPRFPGDPDVPGSGSYGG